MDKVRLVAQERLDLDDARGLQDLVYEYVTRAFGDILGFGSGVVAPFAYTLVATPGGDYHVALSDLAFYHSEVDGSRVLAGVDYHTTFKGRVVNLDASGQSHQVNYTAARTLASVYFAANPDDPLALSDPLHAASRGGQAADPANQNYFPWLWARPMGVDSDSGARKQWNIASGAEVNITTLTRTRERVEFAFSAAVPEAGAGASWVRIGRITEWSRDNIQPTVRPIYLWDSTELTAWCGEAAVSNPSTDSATADSTLWSLDNVLLGTASTDFGLSAIVDFEEPKKPREVGLIRLLYLIRNRVRRILSSGLSDAAAVAEGNWLDVPKYSLAGLADHRDDATTGYLARLDALDTAVAGLSTVSGLGQVVTNVAAGDAHLPVTKRDLVLFVTNADALNPKRILLRSSNGGMDASYVGRKVIIYRDARANGSVSLAWSAPVAGSDVLQTILLDNQGSPADGVNAATLTAANGLTRIEMHLVAANTWVGVTQ